MSTPSSPSTVIGPQHKSFPPALWGVSTDDAVARGVAVSDLATPLLVLDAVALERNTGTIAKWHDARRLRWAPHGKTSMSPWIWRHALDAGAWGVTVATPWQALVADSHAVTRILIANEVIDPVGLDALASVRAELLFFVDSEAAIAAASAAAARGGTRFDVVVDLGGTGGRAGVRTTAEALALADVVSRDPRLRLRGVGGYEGALAHDRDAASIETVTTWAHRLADVHRSVMSRGLYEGGRPVVTASGSLYFDVVGDVLSELVDDAEVVLRPGAVQTHDAGLYQRLSPLAGSDEELVSAIHVWAHVISCPEPGLAILDAGRRDVPYDQDLPAIDRIGADPVQPIPLAAVDDQHAYVRSDASLDLSVGDRVRLSLSHPCTAFDKWRLVPVTADGSDPRAAITAFAETNF
ncbi:D-serine deaminase-like pyridoxal phosphate-dependent protein [Microbacterium sp. AG1240]|uniref:alanine racemase n=1 Tax=Microbacterium sp. AG1240 TaxID=2183992 RepID=UPI000EB299C3|nr:alanine racemase [Microbacterium sp. AG1240]RKT31617.1 D-serine deaminase-like pyridoxal phosphate-dependent protein [Microbacterium sp. AG1240]